MTTTIIPEFILPTLTRYIDRYHWSWNISTRVINNYYGTRYTERELRKLYQRSPPEQRSGGSYSLTYSKAPMA